MLCLAMVGGGPQNLLFRVPTKTPSTHHSQNALSPIPQYLPPPPPHRLAESSLSWDNPLLQIFDMYSLAFVSFHTVVFGLFGQTPALVWKDRVIVDVLGTKHVAVFGESYESVRKPLSLFLYIPTYSYVFHAFPIFSEVVRIFSIHFYIFLGSPCL